MTAGKKMGSMRISQKGPMTEEQKHEAAMFEKVDAIDAEKEKAI